MLIMPWTVAGNVVAGGDITLKEAESYVSSRQPGSYSCNVCGYQAQQKQRLLYHVEAKHMEGPGYQCDICQKSCRTKNAMFIHKSRFHRSENI